MNTMLRYIAIIAAFAAAALAFISGAIWAGALATIAGILVAATIIRSDHRPQ